MNRSTSLTDPRPVLFCPQCVDDVVILPNGRCPWCDHWILRVNAGIVLKLHMQRVHTAA